LKRSIIQVLKYLLFISLGLLLLYFAFRNIDFNSVKRGLLEANYSWIILSFVFSIFAFISRARRWILLTNPLGFNPSLKNAFLAMMTGYLANIALPRLGEVTKCVALGKKENIPVDKLVGTVIVERTIDFISLLIIMIIMLFISSDKIGSFLNSNIIYPVQLKLASIFEFTLIFWLIILIIISSLLFTLFKFRKRIASVKLFARIFYFSKGIIEGIKTVTHLERKMEFLFHTVFIWINYGLMTWVVVFAVKSTSGLSFSDAIFLLVIGSLAMSAPVQSGIGAFHWIISRGLNVVYGISLEDGLVYAIISHESQLIIITIIGAVSFVILFMRHKKKHLL
jgi:glycosyltransferase 2 family protein